MDKGAQDSGSPSPLSQRCSGGLGKGDNAQVTAIPSGLPVGISGLPEAPEKPSRQQ